ncbi:MAG: transcription elongation factor Spt5 [Candidatus Methanomethylicia archaeon]
MPYFTIRTTAGQEKSSALLIETRAKAGGINISAIIAPENVKGFIFIEAKDFNQIDRVISGIKHVKGRTPGMIYPNEIEKFIVPKSPLEDLKVGDMVEIVSGPFRGMTGKVTRISVEKEELTLELMEVTYTLPITINADAVRKIVKAR